jgi:hypothetical protein
MSGFRNTQMGDYLTRRLLPNSCLSVYGARFMLGQAGRVHRERAKIFICHQPPRI